MLDVTNNPTGYDFGWCKTYPGHYVILGGRPGEGKTALALQTMLNFDERVMFISIEMSKRQVLQRACANVGCVSLTNILDNTLSEAELTKLAYAADTLANKDWLILGDDSSLEDIISAAVEYQPRLIVIDYIQLIALGDGDNRHQKLGALSKALRRFGKQTGTTVLALSQLNRDADGLPPTIKHLAESSELERDADVVALIHKTGDDFSVNVAKNKHGQMGNNNMLFVGPVQTIVKRTDDE